MSISKPLAIKILTSLLLGFGAVSSFAQCRKIDADAKVVRELNDTSGKQSITIDFKGANKETFKVSLFGPERKNEINVEKSTFNNLNEGKYIIVIVGKREEDNYCPKSINVTIN